VPQGQHEDLFSLFETLYSIDLSNYIWGQLSPAQESNLYGIFGWAMALSTLVIAVVYYFVIDRYSLSHWWCWLIAMVIPAAINIIVGYSVLANQDNQGMMIDAKGNSLGFNSFDFLSFGIADGLVSILWFIILTLIFKILFKYNLAHSQCSKSPF
jgi:hypothetical protein